MEYRHFSHPHSLKIHQVKEGQTIRCSGCEKLCYNTTYACSDCNYFLHDYCGNAVRYIKHRSDAKHPLVLIPKPTYCSGSFICDACGETGSSFSYCCALCEIDLHVHCAFLPPKVNHKAHQHELRLYIGVANKKDEFPDIFCKICSKVLNIRQYFSYFCIDCEFGAHTLCATNEVKPELFTVDDSSAGSGTSNSVNQATAEEVIVELYNLNLQKQMAQGLADIMASFKII